MIRVDIFRPADVRVDEKIPAIMAWSVYGKSGVGFPNLEWLPYRACVPELMLSGYEKFEGPDPAFFCEHGYAVVNADARGTWDSEGDMVWSCSQEGRDGADLVDWIGQQEWCNGKVGMAGNSWLARAVSISIPNVVCADEMFLATFSNGTWVQKVMLSCCSLYPY